MARIGPRRPPTTTTEPSGAPRTTMGSVTSSRIAAKVDPGDHDVARSASCSAAAETVH